MARPSSERGAPIGAGERSVVPPTARKHTVRPWFLVPLEALPVPVPWSAVALSALLFGVGLLLRPAAEPPPGFVWERMLAVVSVLTGYSIVAAWMAIRSARLQLAALRPLLSCSDAEYDNLDSALIRQRPSSLILAALVGSGIAAALIYYHATVYDMTHRSVPGIIIATGTLEWVIVVSASWILLSIALVFRWVGARLPRIDLFQIEALAPFQRLGLRLSLVFFGLFAIRFVVGARPGNLGYLAITSAVAMLVGTAFLLLPLWGVHRRIAVEKQRELATVRRSIDGERARDLPGATNVSRKLLDLLEYKERVESVSEWPLDVPAVLRFGLYLTIPVLGWLGGAAMERLLDVVVAP
jgi:hypothetical protein